MDGGDRALGALVANDLERGSCGSGSHGGTAVAAEPDVDGGGHMDNERAPRIEESRAGGGAEVDGFRDEVEGVVR